MENVKVVANVRDLRKAAFAVGFGLTVGKSVGKLVGAVVDGIAAGTVQFMAKKGNKAAQKACDSAGINYDEKPENE